MVIYHYVVRTSKNEHSGAISIRKEIENQKEYAQAKKFIAEKLGLKDAPFAITKMKVIHTGSAKDIRTKMKRIERLAKKQRKGA